MTNQASCFLGYKGMHTLSTMMVNLPCLQGSMSQLPSYHLFIHRVPAKLLNGVTLHGINSCRLQLMFVLEASLTSRRHQMVLNMSADAFPVLSDGGLYRGGDTYSAMGLLHPKPRPAPERIARNPGWILDGLALKSRVTMGQNEREGPNHASTFKASGRTISLIIRSWSK